MSQSSPPTSPSVAPPSPEAGLAAYAFPILLLGAVAIAFAPIFVRLSEIPPTATAFHRVFLSLPLLWLWMVLTPAPKPSDTMAATGGKPGNRRDYLMLSLPGLFFAGDLAFWHWSIAYTTVANATLLANVAPVFVTIAVWALFGQRPTLKFIGGMSIALLGAGVLMSKSLSLSPDHLLGDGLGIITAVFYAAYLLSVNRLRARFSTAVIMTWSSLYTALCLLPIALLNGESLVPVSWFGWAMLLGLAWLSHAGGQSMIAFAMAHLPPAFGSVSLLLQPALAALLAWVLLSEGMGIVQGFGGILVLAGILLARKGSPGLNRSRSAPTSGSS